MDKCFPQRKNPRLKEFDYSSPQVYFLTTCTRDKHLFFTPDELNRKIISCLEQERGRLNYLIFCYCLMPDHLHLLLQPTNNGIPTAQIMGSIKGKTTRICWEYSLAGKIWQGRFYDHILRKEESISKIIEYILNNPVRRSLAGHWQDYPYCGIIDPIT